MIIRPPLSRIKKRPATRSIRDKINTDKKTILGCNFLVNWFAGVALIYAL